MKDSHVHTLASHDGRSRIGEYVDRAREIGIDEITFTDHWDDYLGVDTELSTIDVKRCYEVLLSEREKTDLKLNFGIEIGLRPHLAEKIKNLTEDYPFDFIIGSSHITKGMDLAFDSRFFEGLTRREAYMQYFEEALRNVEGFSDYFDVYGHIDYIVRYGGYPEKSIEYAEFGEIIDEIFLSLIKRGKGIEINTSGYRYGLLAPHPNFELVKRYRELGGEIITLGSDAHRAIDLASHFNEVGEPLLAMGFKEIAFYRNRMPEFYPIAEFLK